MTTTSETSSTPQAWANKEFMDARYPQGIKWDIDISKENIATILEESVQKYGDKPCIDFMGKKFTYAQIGEMVDNTAKGLAEMGVKKGDRVGLYMPNSPYYPVMFFAATKIGATAVNFSPAMSLEQLEEQVKDSQITTMVSLDLNPFFDNARTLQKKGLYKKTVKCRFDNMMPFFKKWGFRVLESLKSIFGKAMTSSDSAKEKDNVFRFSKLQTKGGDNAAFTTAVDAENDVAVLQYTGGTTGLPKGAMLTHFNLMANAQQIEQLYGFSDEKDPNGVYVVPGQEKILAVLPYFHVFGMMVGMVYALKSGSEIVMVPNPRDFKDILKTIDKKKPTIVPAIPQLLQKLVEFKGFENYDVSSIKGVVSGGAALPPGVQKAFEEAVGKAGLIKQGYGLTETSPLAAVNPPSGLNRPETIGIACPGTQIRIADPKDASKTMPLGEKGEIAIAGPQVMKGYFNKPEATAETMHNEWFLTGDLGIMTEDGYVQIVDRKKRMIIVNGNNVYPNQVENALSKHPDVAECVIIKISDKRSGEAAKAIIRLKEGVQPIEENIRGFLHSHIKGYEMPKVIEFTTEEILKTAVGKPDWKTLEDMEKAKQEAKETAPAPATPAAPAPKP
jgi:long-chain acyl-CoA synthetase